MIPELPYDIWCLIAKYIPQNALWKLYGVNEAFFDIVMDQRYGEVSVYHSTISCTKPCLSKMGPAVLKHVQALSIHPHLYSKRHEAPPNKRRNRFKERRKAKEIAICQTQLQQRIEQMTRLTSLTIGCYPGDSLEAFNFSLPLYSTAWSTHGARLTSLVLNIPAEAIPAVISAAPPLSALHDLTIVIRLAYHTTHYEDALISTADFIGRHGSTLTTLAIGTPSSIISPLLLFSNIPTLPRLTKLSVSIWYDRLRPQYDTKIDQFLERQNGSLTDLTLRFAGPSDFDPPPSPVAFFSSPLFQVPLPHLKILDLEFCRWPQEYNDSVTENLVKYLCRLPDSLTKLAIGCYMLNLTQIKEIIAIYSHEHSRMECLDVVTRSLSCDLLDLLDEQLPQLKDLELCFNYMTHHEDNTAMNQLAWSDFDARAASFAEGMAQRKYVKWGLRHLTITPIHGWLANWGQCRRSLLDALPGVTTFNDIPREEFSHLPEHPQGPQVFYEVYFIEV